MTSPAEEDPGVPCSTDCAACPADGEAAPGAALKARLGRREPMHRDTTTRNMGNQRDFMAGVLSESCRHHATNLDGAGERSPPQLSSSADPLLGTVKSARASRAFGDGLCTWYLPVLLFVPVKINHPPSESKSFSGHRPYQKAGRYFRYAGPGCRSGLLSKEHTHVYIGTTRLVFSDASGKRAFPVSRPVSPS